MTKTASAHKPAHPTKNKATKMETHVLPASPAKTKRSAPRKKTSPATEAPSSKQKRLIAMMKQAKGSTMTELIAATGWQAHSIRGLISGVLKKRLSLNIISEATADGVRRYRILKSAQA